MEQVTLITEYIAAFITFALALDNLAYFLGRCFGNLAIQPVSSMLAALINKARTKILKLPVTTGSSVNATITIEGEKK